MPNCSKLSLQACGHADLNVWMDVENLIPGSPAWRREIERSIRDAESIIIRRVDGTDLRQLTDNGSCDHQLRWGN